MLTLFIRRDNFERNMKIIVTITPNGLSKQQLRHSTLKATQDCQQTYFTLTYKLVGYHYMKSVWVQCVGKPWWPHLLLVR